MKRGPDDPGRGSSRKARGALPLYHHSCSPIEARASDSAPPHLHPCCCHPGSGSLSLPSDPHPSSTPPQPQGPCPGQSLPAPKPSTAPHCLTLRPGLLVLGSGFHRCLYPIPSLSCTGSWAPAPCPASPVLTFLLLALLPECRSCHLHAASPPPAHVGLAQPKPLTAELWVLVFPCPLAPLKSPGHSLPGFSELGPCPAAPLVGPRSPLRVTPTSWPLAQNVVCRAWHRTRGQQGPADGVSESKPSPRGRLLPGNRDSSSPGRSWLGRWQHSSFAQGTSFPVCPTCWIPALFIRPLVLLQPPTPGPDLYFPGLLP